MARKASSKPADSTANLGFEAKLWLAADKLRNNMDAAEYKHVVLGLILLKYISDSFEEHHAELVEGKEDYEGANPEDKDEYLAANVFWVPPAARWSHLQANAKFPSIGKIVDDAMVAIERDNPRLKGVLPKDYARPALDKHRLGELIDLIGTIGLGDKESRSKDILGRVYEPREARQIAQSAARRVSAASQYFLTQFASAEGKNGGQSSGARKTANGSPKGERGGVHQFYTPSCVVRLLVEMLAPYTALRDSAFLQSEAKPQVVRGAKDNDRICDPACGFGGSLPASRLRGVRFAVKDRATSPGGVQSEKLVESHGVSCRPLGTSTVSLAA